MAHAKHLGGPFMAHLLNLYNIPCLSVICFKIGLGLAEITRCLCAKVVFCK